MTDDDHRDWLARLQERQRQLAALLEQCDAIRAANRANLERLRAIERRLS
jgi:hypothetical protein